MEGVGRIHLPPIQDMLHRSLPFTSETPKKDYNSSNNHYVNLPVSPISSTSSTHSFTESESRKRLSLSPPMAPYSKPRIHSNHQQPNYSIKNRKMYSDWEHRRSADNEKNQQIEYKDANKRMYNINNNEVEEPLQQFAHYSYGRSHSDQILPRRSSASTSSSTNSTSTTLQQQRVDPPRLIHHHRRTASEFLDRRRSCSDEEQHLPYRTSYSPPLNINNSNTNRYKCNQCLKTFSRPSSLRIHILSHTGEKPHVCPQPGCGRRFSVQSNMRRHLKVHYCNPQQQQQQQQQTNYGGRLQ